MTEQEAMNVWCESYAAFENCATQCFGAADKAAAAVIAKAFADYTPQPDQATVERVARAIYAEDDVWHSAFPWPDLQPDQIDPDNYRRIARAAIAAMKETPNADR